ncbi:RNA polymerase sigma factor FliA [Solemya velesiana gill symbiont]|uniref:RNA polymerase sigma factor FliA n=1 Tax=Solemya velesiana gill symbiont TaxID=1918948 RepID=A0A1T2KWU9_9GAMM|nr:RNA polymerase sigma factor FliA [Solemya velesiana gill symbiont]OOZ37240.1 RNA polymerase sigma factor FliA [Solemya velesiana gill symbiont]
MNGLATYAAVQSQDPDALVARHSLLVKRIAYHLMNRLPPNVQADDLIQAGMIGLLEASRNYDPSQGASFETYAGIRIRGAMLDEIRRSDWTPRSVHRKARMVADAMRDIENEEGRDARDIEVASALDMSLDDYHKILQDASGCRIFSVEELQMVGELPQNPGETGTNGPFEGMQKDAFKEALADAIAGLPERERLVIALYYDDELNLREIGQVLGVSESRVCQIHSQATLRLRSRLSDWLSEGGEL